MICEIHVFLFANDLCACVWFVCVFFGVRVCVCVCVYDCKKLLRVLLICCVRLYGLDLLYCLCASVLLVRTCLCLC